MPCLRPRARIWGSPGGAGWRAGARTRVAVRQFPLPRWRSKLRAAVGRGRRCAVPRLPRHGQAECLARCAGAAPLFTATCVWRLLIERGMSWNDTASTDVELQSALQFLIPLGLVCPLCRFSPSAFASLLCYPSSARLGHNTLKGISKMLSKISMEPMRFAKIRPKKTKCKLNAV